MQNETVARRYAAAIFSLALSRDAVDRVGRDLHAAAASIAGDGDVRRFFVSPVIERRTKMEILQRAFGERMDEIALNALLLLVRKRREALLGPIVAAYDALALAQSGRESLEVVSAHELDSVAFVDIVQRVSAASGKQFEVTQRTDPRLLGGVRITMGDRRIDGSLAARLDELARDLTTRT